MKEFNKEKFENKVFEYIKKYNLIKEREKVLIALSGGPDSLCLAQVLFNLKEKLNIGIYAAHINHNLRGEESDKDEKFVEKWCKERDIPCFVLSADIVKRSKEEKRGTEETARIVRYEFFEKVVKENHLDKIAIAHNKNDQGETVLFRMLRGSGSRGLNGMKPIRDKIYIRPLLGVERREIESYLKESNIDARIDKTNLETDYTRNKIRLELIPYIEENFNKDIINTLYNLSMTLSVDEDYLNLEAKKVFKEKVIVENSKANFNSKSKVVIDSTVFKEHKAISSRVIFLGLEEILGNRLNIEKKHIDEIIKLSANQSGKRVDITNDVVVVNNYSNIEIIRASKKIKEENNSEININTSELNEVKTIVFNNYEINLWKTINEKENHVDKIKRKEENLSQIDIDSLETFVIRSRRQGDIIKPLGMNGLKKIKNVFIDKKIEREKRDILPLFVKNANEVIFITGGIINEDVRIKSNTKAILNIKIRELS